MILYHGTSLSALPFILAHGIRPRGKDRKRNNWAHTVGSNPNAVYLSTCYPLHFALAAKGEGESAVIIEVDTLQLEDHLLIADEDAIEQAMRGNDGLPQDWEMKRRTIYYRTRAHHWKGAASLQLMGTCAYRGTVPRAALGRSVAIDAHNCMRLVLEAFDPVISILNYHYMGRRHEAFTQWLFDPSVEYKRTFGAEELPPLSREGIQPAQFC